MVSFRRLTPKQVEALSKFDTPTICNAIETFAVRDRTEGYFSREIRCLFPDLGVMLGHAVTATVDSTTPGPAPERKHALERYIALMEAVRDAPQPVVILLKDVSPDPTRGCHFGDGMASKAVRLGAVGLITDGGVRDLKGVRDLGFQYFSPGVVASHGNTLIIDVNVPVTLGGVVVEPGDVIHGDANGAVVVPWSMVDGLAEAAGRVEENEARGRAYVDSPEFTLDGLRRFWGI